MNNFIINNNKFNKKKVVFIMGATGTEKSRLSVDLVTHFRGEIINSDKMQVYKGFDIVTNKITHAEKQGVRHYLLGQIEPHSDFTAEDFWSNLYIEKLVEDPVFMFKCKYDGCFIWIDVEQSVLNRSLDTRVDEMVNAGTKMNTFINNNNKFNKKKMEFIMGAIGPVKSSLSVDLATHFRGEIINSDKMQVYRRLDIVTNKITHIEKQGVRQYLLGEIVPNSDFMAEDICLKAISLVSRVDTRVDEMVNAGLVNEVRQIFIPDADYTKGIRRFIGVPEMASNLREENNIDGDD
ncbi:hypothetical protein H5410_064565 [Solanum commersonii]|uniref:Isopentenyltransferase n=1 Tax=Solanum commersonii TaxID=4109 RepID=A0A9J5VZ17_SOLCO|nr:hypothetical protein H5410_064565 [Solanum commersonii]